MRSLVTLIVSFVVAILVAILGAILINSLPSVPSWVPTVWWVVVILLWIIYAFGAYLGDRRIP